MIEVIDQYGERHRFDDNHCIHDADSATGMVQIGVSNDSGDYDVVATFLHPARFGEVSDDTCFTLRAVPAGVARQLEELRAENENEKLKADAKYGWQAHGLILKNQVLEAELADAKENAREWKLAASAATDMLETEQEKVKALEATWIGYNKLQEQLAAEREKVKELSTWLDDMEAEARDFAFQVERKTEQLVIAQATIAELVQHAKDSDIGCGGVVGSYEIIAHAIPTNQDALNEMLARECERLAGDGHLSIEGTEWLLEEAAAHRARKEGK